MNFCFQNAQPLGVGPTDKLDVPQHQTIK